MISDGSFLIMKSLKLHILVFALFLSPFVHAQNFKLKVFDSEDQKALPFVHVSLHSCKGNDEIYTATDKNGFCQLNVKETSVLVLHNIGYETIHDTIQPGMSEKEYSMLLTGFDVDEVIVTCEYKPVAIDKSIYDIKLIGKNQIHNQAANNLGDLLSEELSFKLSHDPSVGTKMQLQGISGENVKILIDGVPVIGRLDGNIDLGQINLSNVDHVEIIEGPMSVIYGSNALAGVINIITKENKHEKFKLTTNAYYESVGVYNANADVSFKLGKNLLSFYGGRNFFAGYDINEENRVMDFKPKEQINSGFAYSFFAADLDIKYKASFFQERLLDQTNLSHTPYSIRGFDSWVTTIRAENSLKVFKEISEKSYFDVMVDYSYYNREKLVYVKDLTTLESTLVSDSLAHDTSIFKAFFSRGMYNLNNSSGKINIQSGYDINTEYASGKRIKGENQNIQDYAAYAVLKWHLFNGFTFQPGLRYAYNTKFKAPLAPSLNVKYNFLNYGIRASYARGFRAPSLKELYLDFVDTNHFLEGNEDLKAEYSHSYNTSLHGSFGKNTHLFDFSVKGYYTSLKNMITLVHIDPDNDLHYSNVNIAEAERIGGQVDLRYKFQPHLKVNLGVARLGRYDSDFPENNWIYSNNLNAGLTVNFLKNSATASLFYKFNDLYPDYFYSGDEDDYLIEIIEAYHELDFTVSKSFFNNRLRFTAGAKNLLNNINIGRTGGGGSGHGDSDAVSTLVSYGRVWFAGVKMNISRY